MKNVSRVFAALLVGCIPTLALAAAPYPPSPVIQDVKINWSTHDRRAPGSDNWAITWAADGQQIATFGDGGGFDGTNSSGRVSLGFARITGSPTSYTGSNIWGGFNAENAAQFDGKSYGVLDINGTLYAWWGPGSATTSYRETRLLRSTNGGASWQKSSWDLTAADGKLIMPTILNFGRGYAGARDNYVYHYFIRREETSGGHSSGLGIHKSGTGKIDLARVPRDQIMNNSAYEYFAGMSGGQPTWTRNALQRVPVFQDPNGVGWNLSVSYNAGLGRYMLMTEHSETWSGLLGMFDAPQPWGPWTTVAYHTSSNPFGGGRIATTTFFWNFANKWLSNGGKHFVLLFTGGGGNDSWNSVEGDFIVDAQAGSVPKPPVLQEP